MNNTSWILYMAGVLGTIKSAFLYALLPLFLMWFATLVLRIDGETKARKPNNILSAIIIADLIAPTNRQCN